jgi:hypothetical protein
LDLFQANIKNISKQKITKEKYHTKVDKSIVRLAQETNKQKQKSEIKIIFEKYSCIVSYNKGNSWIMYWHDNLRHTEKLIFWILWNKRLKIGPLPEGVPGVE